jgi:hypothetical protein
MNKIHFVFTRNDESFVSRAIMWFEQRRTDKERRTSHGLMKFWPGGPVFSALPVSFEAAERGVWMDLYHKSIGKQTIVAEFELLLDDDYSLWAVQESLRRYSDWYYDFEGVAQNAVWILMKKWFGTILRWTKFVWKFETDEKSLFCTGLLYEIAKLAETASPDPGWVGPIESAREATPRKLIDVCYANPNVYKLIRENVAPGSPEHPSTK